jgi:D,D-heptose 1,7-bisphosphate phosphatase
MNKAVFLDRDGTLIEDKGYVHKIEDLKFLPGVFQALKQLQEEYKLIIVTNQSGIGRGYYTEKDYFNFREEFTKRLEKQRIRISREYFCPHHAEKGIGKYKIDCNCRKPKTGMIEEATRDFKLDLKKSWIVGDHYSDIVTGKNAGCRTIHVLTGHDKFVKEADYIAKDILEATQFILSQKDL